MIERRERFRSESKSGDMSFNKYDRKSLSPVSQRYGNVNSGSNSNSNSCYIGNKISSSSRNGSQSSLNRLADIRRSPSISRMRNSSTDSDVDNKEIQKCLRKESKNTEMNEITSYDNKRLSPFITENKDLGHSQKNLTAYSRERGRERGRASRDPLIAENHFLFCRDDLTVEGVSVKLNASNKTGESSRSLINTAHSSSDNKNRMKDFNRINHQIISSESESDSESEKGNENENENENSHELNNMNMNKYCNQNEKENERENENSVDRSESQSGVKEVTASSAYKIATAWRDYITHIMTNKSCLEEGHRALSRRDSGANNDDGDDDDDDDDDGEVDEDYECVQIDRDRLRRCSDKRSREDGGGREREREYGEDNENENDRHAKHSAQLALSLIKISKLAEDMIIIPKERILTALELNINDSRAPKGLQSVHSNINSNINSNNNNNTRIHAFHSDTQTVSEVIARMGSMDEVESNSTLLRNAFLEVVQSMKDGTSRNPVEGFTVDPVKPVRVNPFDLVSDVIDSNFESLNNSLECSAVNSTHTTRRPSLSEAGMLQHHGIMEYHGKIAESKSSTVNHTDRKFDYDDSVKSECYEMSGEYEEEFYSEVENEIENNHFNFNSHEIHAILSSSQEFGKKMKMEKEEKIENYEGEDGGEGSEDEYNSDFEDEKSM